MIDDQELRSARQIAMEALVEFTESLAALIPDGIPKDDLGSIYEYFKSLSALRPGSETDGFVLVPREPTKAMCLAGREESKNLFEQPICRADAKDIYRAMLAAAGGENG